MADPFLGPLFSLIFLLCLPMLYPNTNTSIPFPPFCNNAFNPSSISWVFDWSTS
ncbi:hypothetical protein MANES_02G110950v8 [Manihot esculenta]|uniref:Uncharacterized protein n=1 Tax=Manihot esculenta TaxID=3983 RepID=A0ACB7I4S4_MANES|nr:hypothetical protein MANES_02G110950v8 [Manihot esculenta]